MKYTITANMISANEELQDEIIERKQSEETLRKSEEKLQAIINNSTAVIFVKDLEGKYLLINSLYEKLFHISKEQIIGKTDYDIFSKKAADGFRKTDLAVLKGKKAIEVEETVPQDDGPHYYISLKFPLYDIKEKPYAVCGIATDITRRKEADEALKARETDLEAQANNLEELNTALKVLLRQREDDKKELQESILSNVKNLILPNIERLKKSKLRQDQMTMIQSMESYISEIISPFMRELSSIYIGLTPTEIKVASLIKEGKSTKEIAEMLYLSVNTILFHRHNIRSKLNIKNKKTNLRSYLQTLI